MTSERPQDRGEYGTVALDFFMLEKWDFSLPVAEDIQRWETISKEYRALTALQRFPYHQQAWARNDMSSAELAASLPPAYQIDRVLRPFQTKFERVISASPGGSQHPLWLRTCYLPSLAEAYESMASDAYVGDWGIIPEHNLDDPGLYDWPGSDGWEKILVRIPGIVDVIQCSIIEEYAIEDEVFDHDPHETEYEKELRLASDKAHILIYVIDEEAIHQRLVKRMWLDIHGNTVWRSKIEPSEVEQFAGSLLQGHYLAESIDRFLDYNSTGQADS